MALSLPVLILSLLEASSGSFAAAREDAFEDVVRPFVAAHCAECHGVQEPEADLDLTRYGDTLTAIGDQATWRSVRELLAEHEMPPHSAPQPSDAERAAVIAWIDATLGEPVADGPLDPGRPTLRRLNRTEYENTILDLFGIEFRTDELFPADDVPAGEVLRRRRAHRPRGRAPGRARGSAGVHRAGGGLRELGGDQRT